MITLKDIAVAAQVHVSTASAVLNSTQGNTRVGEEARQRVIAAAKKLGYVANDSARRLRTGTSKAVGFLGGDFRNPFFAELAARLEKALSENGFQLFVSHVAEMQPSSLEEAITTLSQQGVHSIICWEESTLRKLRVRTPIYSIGFSPRSRAGIWLDLEWAIQLAVERQIQNGARRLGFYAPNQQRESPSVQLRMDTFVRICQQAGLPHPVLACYQGESWDVAAAMAGLEQCWDPAVEGWVGFNDVAALALLSRSNDVSQVVCSDGTALCRAWPGRPPCLNLRIDVMVEKLVKLVTGNLPSKPERLRAEWV